MELGTLIFQVGAFVTIVVMVAGVVLLFKVLFEKLKK